MKTSVRQLFLGAAVACFFALTLAGLAQEKPSVPAEPAPQAAPAVTPAPAPPAEAAPAAPAPGEEKKEPELRRIDTTPAPSAAPTRRPNTRSGRSRVEGLHVTRHDDNAVVSVAHDSFLAKDQQADAVISVLGSSTSEGEVADAVVSVLGNTRVTGPVGDSAVAVLGNTYVNSKVGGEVVAVLGDVELGPEAEVGGDVVSVGGAVKRDPKAILHGNVQNVAIGGGAGALVHFSHLQAWFRECLLLGRPLAFSREVGFAWTFAIAFFALYALIALVFGRGVDKCVTTLETRPGSSILTAILSVLLTPVLIVLLCITIIGIAAVPFLALGLVVAGLFGKTVMLAWVGRRITKFFGDGPLNHAAVATLIGGAIVLLLYCVPFVGMLVQKTFDLLGFGVVVFTLILANKREKPPAPPRMAAAAPIVPPSAPVAGVPSVPPAPPAMPMMSAGFGAASGVVSEPAGGDAAMSAVPPPPAEPVPPVGPRPAPSAAVPISALTTTRAGFLIRTWALFVDIVLIAILTGMLSALIRSGFSLLSELLSLPHPLRFNGGPSSFLLVLALYGAVMWKLKGTTIGGIVAGLKVVRLDDRAIDWATAVVRALGCFLSLAVVGLGFLWVAIDDEKQSWHDKIAGTTVVRVPKGVSLL